MSKLSGGQLERASEVAGNIATAWFSAGVISPLFTHPRSSWDIVFRLTVSLIMASGFFLISLKLAKEIKV